MTDEERTILAHLCRIRASLEPNKSAEWEVQAEAYEYGYTTFYEELHGHEDPQMQREAREFLDMFRSLSYSMKAGEIEDDELRRALTFTGFDANEGTHSSFAKYMRRVHPDWWKETDITLNSHTSSSVPTYRRMHKRWRELVGPYSQKFSSLSEDELREIAAESVHPSNR